MHRIYANAANSRLLLPIHFNTLQRALDQNGPIIDGSIPLMLSVGSYFAQRSSSFPLPLPCGAEEGESNDGLPDIRMQDSQNKPNR